jgi:hypothetical protein
VGPCSTAENLGRGGTMELLAITVYLQLQSVQRRRVVTTIGMRFQRLLIFIEKVINII